jgi:uncharacterized protein (TIGR03435 family)
MTNPVSQKTGRVRVLRLLVAATLFVASTTTAKSQTAKPLAFEVASVKANSAGTDPRQLMQTMSLQYLPGGRFAARGVPVPVLIFEAYGVAPGPGRRIDLSPEFAKSMDRTLEAQPYDIDAVAEKGAIPANASPSVQRDAIRLMLQTLLAERFKVRIRHETKEVPVYAMVVGKNGSKLQKSAIEETRCTVTSNDKPQFIRLFNSPDPTACHSFAGGPRPGLRGDAVDMSDLAAMAERFSDRPVVDHTGLSGLYKIAIPGWELAGPESREQSPRAAGSETTVDKALGDPGRATFSDVLQSLGLRLESTKASVDMFVVEHFEKPVQN